MKHTLQGLALTVGLLISGSLLPALPAHADGLQLPPANKVNNTSILSSNPQATTQANVGPTSPTGGVLNAPGPRYDITLSGDQPSLTVGQTEDVTVQVDNRASTAHPTSVSLVISAPGQTPLPLKVILITNTPPGFSCRTADNAAECRGTLEGNTMARMTVRLQAVSLGDGSLQGAVATAYEPTPPDSLKSPEAPYHVGPTDSLASFSPTRAAGLP
jgi:hypothetical protein